MIELSPKKNKLPMKYIATENSKLFWTKKFRRQIKLALSTHHQICKGMLILVGFHQFYLNNEQLWKLLH